MVRTCSNCGAVTPTEARFCRHCGALLKVGTTFDDNEPISPLAQTVPLSSEGLTTSGLSTDDAGGTAADTKRVARAEMEQMLRRAPFATAPDGRNDGDGSTATVGSDYAAPPTGELTEKPEAPAVSPSSPLARAAASTSINNRPRRLWPQVTIMLLLATLSVALLVYYFLKQRGPLSAVELTDKANSNQAAESVNTNSPVDEAGAEAGATGTPDIGPQSEETPQPSPKPSASVEQSREERAKQEREERGTETTVLNATPTPAPTATATAQATPAQTTSTPSPAPTNNSGGTQAAQASSDSFYFQAVNLVNGREPRSMPRAELLRALQLFQNVKNGPHAAEARRQAARLGRELDRLSKQSQR